MDCERPYKYCALRQLFSIICILAVMSCTWVKDDTDDCPYGFWLKLNYTYNILDVDAASKYVQDASVYVYDAAGNYVKTIYASRVELLANNYRVKVEDLPEGDYQFVVWSGIDSQFKITSGTNPIDEFRLTLVPPGGGFHYKGTLPDLFHGFLPSAHYDDSYAVYDVELTKDTNQFTCLVVSINNEAVMNPNDYNMVVVASNSVMDAYNRLHASVPTVYEPNAVSGVNFDDIEYGDLKGIQFSIPTLRLLDNWNNRIILEKSSNGQKLFDISLSEYIGMIGNLYTNMGKQISVQDYLDRQDYYTVVFYLSDDLETLISLKVNNWRLRANYHLNL